MLTTIRNASILSAMLVALLTVALQADEQSEKAGIEFFEKKIRPVLAKHCYECHSATSKKVQGGLLLDSRRTLLKGGESGAAVVPGRPEKSLLIRALRHSGPEMPPAGKLPEQVIADFVAWIKMGAPIPKRGTAAPASAKPNDPQGESPKLWSLQPVDDPPVPDVADQRWPKSDIDRFILARLEKEGLKPVGDAEPLTLLRRLYFDLVGLPPPPEQIEAFQSSVQQDRSSAIEALVDHLLDSPQFGERWARHWLDVARYAESNGKSRDVLMPHAWRYRDYVIDAYNADLPYDRFLTEQIAGDLLPADSPEERDRLMVATGFLALGSKTLVGNTKQVDLIDEQIDVVGKAVLGMTISCARCHDHKFDPIPTRDYYALSGIFLSTETLYGGGLRRAKNLVGQVDQLLVLGENSTERVKQLKQHQQTIARLQKERSSLQKKLKQLQKKLPKDWRDQLQTLKVALAEATKNKQENEAAPQPPAEVDKKVVEYAGVQDEFRSLQQRLKQLQDQKLPELQFAVGVRDANKPRNSKIHIRGEVNQLGQEVRRGFLSCIAIDDPPEIPQTESGRLQLAQWLTHPDNPLTARVAVNRIWLHLFGRGIVETVDNFGNTGSKPTHPELLDHLARRFMENGWSTKQMIRQIVLSRVYQLSSDYDEKNYATDPQNTFYWRQNRRRLEAEALRDAMLAAAGRLNLERPYASAVAEIGDGEVGRGINTRPLYKPFPHRSVYLPIIRGIVPEMLKVFDFPEPSNPQGRRSATNVPAQSLYLMNSPFVIEQAEAMAQRVVAAETDREARLQLAYKLALGRLPSEQELLRSGKLLDECKAALRDQKPSQVETACWSTLCQALFAAAEFRYIE